MGTNFDNELQLLAEHADRYMAGLRNAFSDL